METQIIFIVIAAITQFILGAVWYSPLLFGNRWMQIMEATHFSKEELQKMQKAMGPFYALQFLLTLFSTFALVNLAAVTPFSLYHIAFWVWLGFIVPTQIAGVIWGNTKKKFWLSQIAIMITYQLVGIMMAAWIIAR